MLRTIFLPRNALSNQYYSPRYWQDTKNYRDDRATSPVLSTEENDNERFMKLTMIEGGKIFLDLIFCLTPFNAIYSQFSLFPFCLSVLDCSLEICPGAVPKLSVARNASTKGTV